MENIEEYFNNLEVIKDTLSGNENNRFETMTANADRIFLNHGMDDLGEHVRMAIMIDDNDKCSTPELKKVHVYLSMEHIKQIAEFYDLIK